MKEFLRDSWVLTKYAASAFGEMAVATEDFLDELVKSTHIMRLEVEIECKKKQINRNPEATILEKIADQEYILDKICEIVEVKGREGDELVNLLRTTLDNIRILEASRYGVVKEYHENGTNKIEINLKDNVRNGTSTVWFVNGQKKLEEKYEAGVRNGTATTWFANGQKKLEVNFVSGIRSGTATAWFANGQKKWEANFESGKPQRIACGWFESGERDWEADFKPNAVTIRLWLKSGKSLPVFRYINGWLNISKCIFAVKFVADLEIWWMVANKTPELIYWQSGMDEFFDFVKK